MQNKNKGIGNKKKTMKPNQLQSTLQNKLYLSAT